MKCKYGHVGNIRTSAPKPNGRTYPECRTCDRNTKRLTRRATGELLRIGKLMAQVRAEEASNDGK